jgi:hypothetical protein
LPGRRPALATTSPGLTAADPVLLPPNLLSEIQENGHDERFDGPSLQHSSALARPFS